VSGNGEGTNFVKSTQSECVDVVPVMERESGCVGVNLGQARDALCVAQSGQRVGESEGRPRDLNTDSVLGGSFYDGDESEGGVNGMKGSDLHDPRRVLDSTCPRDVNNDSSCAGDNIFQPNCGVLSDKRYSYWDSSNVCFNSLFNDCNENNNTKIDSNIHV
jgi:hypothetical protein